MSRDSDERRPVIELFQGNRWQMTAGERAALEGVVSQLKPGLAIEIGTAEGGSLACIASHAREVHSFDLVEPSLAAERFPNVRLHTGDSHQLLGVALREFERQDRNIDFALVDGDHTTDGVRRDVEDLLASAAVSRTVILLHDTANEEVRAGLEAIDFDRWRKVRGVDFDFVPGYLVKADRFHHEIWGGLGLVVVDEHDHGNRDMHLLSEIAYPISGILAQHRARLLSSEGPEQHSVGADQEGAGELDRLRASVADLERRLVTLTHSTSWRITAPGRRLMARLRRLS